MEIFLKGKKIICCLFSYNVGIIFYIFRSKGKIVFIFFY